MPTLARPLLRLGVVVAILAAGAACATTHSPAARPSSGSSASRSVPGASSGFTWSMPAGILSASVTTGLQEALRNSRSLATDLGPGLYVDVQQVQANADQAVLYGVEKAAADGQVVPTEPLVLLATQTGGTWTLFTTVDPGFCPALRGMPATVVDDTMKAFFGGC